MRCHRLDACAQVISPRSMSPRSTLKPGATSPGRGKRPAGLSRPPRAGAKRASSDPIVATRVGPRGARLTSGGSPPWSVPPPRTTSSVQAYVRAVNAHTARLQRREHARHEPAQAGRLHPGVEALQARRGVPCTVAVTLVAALGDLSRVATPSALMPCVGLVPSEDSTGARRRQGASTTAGHRHARRVLVEGAWASRDPANVSRHRPRRLAQHPTASQDISWTAHVRLGQRYRRLSARGTHANQVVVARARERMGCMWAMAPPIPGRPSGHQTEAA